MKTDITIWAFTGFILIIAAVFIYELYKNFEQHEKDRKISMKAREQAWLIDEENEKKL